MLCAGQRASAVAMLADSLILGHAIDGCSQLIYDSGMAIGQQQGACHHVSSQEQVQPSKPGHLSRLLDCGCVLCQANLQIVHGVSSQGVRNVVPSYGVVCQPFSCCLLRMEMSAQACQQQHCIIPGPACMLLVAILQADACRKDGLTAAGTLLWSSSEDELGPAAWTLHASIMPRMCP